MKQCMQEKSSNKMDNKAKSTETDKFTKFRLIKNLVVISITFLISCSASEGLIVLQSTINKNVGVISVAVQYTFGCVAALLLPKYLIKKFGSKTVMVVSMFAYVPYLASNFYPEFSVMIPTSIIVGFASSLIWNSLCTYLNDLSSLYTNVCFATEHKDDTQELVSNERDILKNKLSESPQHYSSIRKHKDSIFITKQTLFGESALFPTLEEDGDLENKSNELGCKPQQMNMIPKVTIVDDCFKEENNKGQEKSELINGKIHTVLKQTYDLLRNGNCKTQLDETQSREKIAGKLYCKKSPDTISGIDPKLTKKKILFQKEIAHLEVVPEGTPKPNSEDRIKCKFISENVPPEPFLQMDQKSKLLETTTAQFFGFFGGVYQMCHIFSNIISYFILHNTSNDTGYIRNTSCVCGSDFCSIESKCYLHNLQLPSLETRYTLTGIYVTMSLLSAVLTLLFLDNLHRSSDEVTFSLDMALMTFKFHRQKNQMLLTPVSFYIGLASAFVMGDYTKAFVGCAWGVDHVALVIVCAGCTISVSSYLFGSLEKYVGRRIIFIATAAVNLAAIITSLCWIPDSTKPTMMFVVSGMWGVVLGVWWCQLRAFIGIIFKEEEETAFGCYQLWHALGCAIGFAYSNYLCSYIKIYILLVVSTLSVFGYLVAERNYAISKKENNS